MTRGPCVDSQTDARSCLGTRRHQNEVRRFVAGPSNGLADVDPVVGQLIASRAQRCAFKSEPTAGQGAWITRRIATRRLPAAPCSPANALGAAIALISWRCR